MYCPPPKNFGMTKVLTAGKKTKVIPEMTPGNDNGKTTLRNVCKGFAPKS